MTFEPKTPAVPDDGRGVYSYVNGYHMWKCNNCGGYEMRYGERLHRLPIRQKVKAHRCDGDNRRPFRKDIDG